jgi:uncharacterized protein YbaP (TraB family)
MGRFLMKKSWALLLACCWLSLSFAALADCPPTVKDLPESLFRTAAAQAKDRGVLWRVRKDGHASYLYGTLHVGRAEWMALGPKLASAFEATDILALELDPLDATIQQDMAQAMARVPVRAISKSQRLRLKQLLDAQCLPTNTVNSTPAELQIISLSAMVGRRDGLDPNYGSEILLSLLAHGVNRPVLSLETVQLQMKALLAQDAAEVQVLVREGLADLEAGLVRKALLQTVKVWESADLEALENYPQWCECVNTPLDKVFMRRLLDERNPGLVQRIDALHSEGKRLLVAVGSLHMAGGQGLPALLQKRGYEVERLQ